MEVRSFILTFAALAVARSILESLEGPESGLSSTTTGPTPGSRIR